MATDGELSYFDAIGDDGRRHALAKPFSDPDRGALLRQVGAIFELLPPPPAAVLDCGCGTGWLASFLQRSGYAATGVDVAPAAIALAGDNPQFVGTDPPRFMVAEVEHLGFDGEFDAVLFFDSLHHSVDEIAALAGALRALKPGGVCITSEPGAGHAAVSAHEVLTYGVTERDMPAGHIVEVGLRVGFASARVLPRADALGTQLYRPRPEGQPRWKAALRRNLLARAALTVRTTEWAKRDNGIVVLTAPR